jgi:citrate lyase subunit beta/citryl-CoA lyase
MTRAWLFVPGNRADRVDKALAAGADRVIVDLEDAVAPGDKIAARDALAAWLVSTMTTVRIAVRVNAADTAWFADDLALLDAPSVAVVVLPKAEAPAVVARVAARRPGLAAVREVRRATRRAEGARDRAAHGRPGRRDRARSRSRRTKGCARG